MGAPDSAAVPSVEANSSVDVALRMTSPANAGRYTGFWRLCTPEGVRFGQRLWVDINVIQETTTTSSNLERMTLLSPSRNLSLSVFIWENELKSLRDMGFHDGERNKQLLTELNGDVTAVISRLL